MWSWLKLCENMWKPNNSIVVALVVALLFGCCCMYVDAKKVIKFSRTDAEDYITCVVDLEASAIQTVIFEKFTNTVSSEDECATYCVGYNHHVYLVDNNKEYCFCGNDNSQSTSTTLCTCPNFLTDPSQQPEFGDKLCSLDLIYVPSWVEIPLYLDALELFSTNEEVEVGVKDIGFSAEYRFNFGDGSDIITTNLRSATHVYLQQGIYSVNVEAVVAFGGGTIDFNLHVLDPPGISGLGTPAFVDGTAGQPLAANLVVDQGTEASVTWQRRNPDGSIVKGESFFYFVL